MHTMYAAFEKYLKGKWKGNYIVQLSECENR